MEKDTLRVLVTGGEGFVGKETCSLLNERGIFNYSYDIMNGRDDIRNADRFEEIIKMFSINRVLHLAAIARFSEADVNPKLAHETNVLGTINVARVAGKYHIPVVYASTGSVYMPLASYQLVNRVLKDIYDQLPSSVQGIIKKLKQFRFLEIGEPITEDFPVQGNSVYGVTKALGEKYIQEYASPYIILRYAHLYGKEKRGHGLIGGFLQRIERGLAPTLYGGKQSNDFTFIKDVAEANYVALTASWDKWNQAYNIGTGEELTAEQAGKIICKLVKYEGEIEKKEQREVDPGRFVYDTKKAEHLLGFKAKYNFEEGLKLMFNGNTEEGKKLFKEATQRKEAKGNDTNLA